MRLAGGCLAAILLLFTGLAGLAHSHELEPSSMELRQLTSERFEAIWRAPVYYRKPHPARLQLPDGWQTVGKPSVRQLPDSALHRHVVDVPVGVIDGAVIRFSGTTWASISGPEGTSPQQWVEMSRSSANTSGTRKQKTAGSTR